MFIYNFEGQVLSFKNISINFVLQDATWTPAGNIICIEHYTKEVVTISELGIIITKSKVTDFPAKLYLSSDGNIYLINFFGVYQSVKDGKHWILVFKLIDNWNSRQIIKVTAGNSENFWSLDYQNFYNITVRIYRVHRNPVYNLTWEDLNLLTPTGKYINLASFITAMHYDGVSSIFLSESYSRIIHVFSVTGQYHSQLLSADRVVNYPNQMVVDTEQNILFVGQQDYLVTAFKLNYEEK